jgi:hypothetical protein
MFFLGIYKEWKIMVKYSCTILLLWWIAVEIIFLILERLIYIIQISFGVAKGMDLKLLLFIISKVKLLSVLLEYVWILMQRILLQGKINLLILLNFRIVR